MIMNPTPLCLSAILSLHIALLSPSTAGSVGIDSVTLGGSNELLTATVGGTGYAGGTIADTAEFASDNTNINSATTGGAVKTNTQAATGPEYDNNVLTGTGGGPAAPSNIQTGGILQLYWGVSGGGFTDNDSDPDFFVFEDLGNDTVVVRAILSNDTYGAPVTLSGWNSIASNGVLTTDTQLTGRTVSGVSFSFTDLKDASGANLSNGDMIKGIWIGQQDAADFYEVYANVEPASSTQTSITITGASGGPGSFELDWVTVPANAPVTVRRSSNLDFGVGSTVVDSGNTSGTFTDASAPSGKAFYRLESE